VRSRSLPIEQSHNRATARCTFVLKFERCAKASVGKSPGRRSPWRVTSRALGLESIGRRENASARGIAVAKRASWLPRGVHPPALALSRPLSLSQSPDLAPPPPPPPRLPRAPRLFIEGAKEAVAPASFSENRGNRRAHGHVHTCAPMPPIR
jgi:hypothetical protein